jgi:DNA-nicking Smr family endonuclease
MPGKKVESFFVIPEAEPRRRPGPSPLSRTPTVGSGPRPSTENSGATTGNVGNRSLNTLDANWDKRLAKGTVHPDWTIDLHGHSAASAHGLLDRSLGLAFAEGARIILLITGKAARDNPRLPPTSRGVIRASIADWLASSRHSGQIAAIRNAHPRHGGAGALYLILKRAR